MAAPGDDPQDAKIVPCPFRGDGWSPRSEPYARPHLGDARARNVPLVSCGGPESADRERPTGSGRADLRGARRRQAGSGRAVLPDDARRLLLARRRLRAARSSAVGGLDLEHRRDGRAQGRLRLRHVGRRPDRHPVHDRARHAGESARVVRLRGRERPRPVPDPAERSDRGRPELDGDRHVLVVDRDACRLWELYSAYPQNGGASWTAGSGATWDLNSNAMRPLGWTSGDAAGLPILPGLVRYDEVAAGEIDHVIRFTAPRTANAYVWPASHKAGIRRRVRPADGRLVPAQGELRHQRLLGAEPGDPPRAQEARDGPRRQRLAVLHERRARIPAGTTPI